MSEPVLYSLAEAAKVLGVHYDTVARWVRKGKLQGVKLSRRKVVVAKQMLEAFLAESGPGPGSRAKAGSPRRWMSLVGTLTPEEAELLRRSAEEFEKVDRS